MLDFIGTIVLVAAIIVSINALTGAMPIGPSQRLALSVGAGLWTGLAAALASANLFLGTNPVGPPTIGTMIAFPLVATAVAASVSPSVRASLLGMPMPFLIVLNVWRVAGGFFLLLAAEGRLAGPFPTSAGWGDVITGVLALPVAWLALRGQGRPLVWAWNAFGMLPMRFRFCTESPVDSGISGYNHRRRLVRSARLRFNRDILRRWETIASVSGSSRDCPDLQRSPSRTRPGNRPLVQRF